MPRKLPNHEQETIINFNKAEDTAYIFTYEKTWQKHIEGRLGLKPVMDNGFGGRSYELPKTRIKPPRAPRRLSHSAKKELVERLHANRVLSAKNLVPVGKSDTEIKNKGNSMLRVGAR
ncbi:hypothetical protein ACFLYL_01895 [Chloroflexota bacterium]